MPFIKWLLNTSSLQPDARSRLFRERRRHAPSSGKPLKDISVTLAKSANNIPLFGV
jgi:hypothetical protein